MPIISVVSASLLLLCFRLLFKVKKTQKTNKQTNKTRKRTTQRWNIHKWPLAENSRCGYFGRSKPAHWSTESKSIMFQLEKSISELIPSGGCQSMWHLRLDCCKSVPVLQLFGHRDFECLWQCPVKPVSLSLSSFLSFKAPGINKNWSAFGNDFSVQKRAHKHDVSSCRSCIFGSNRSAQLTTLMRTLDHNRQSEEHASST